MEESPMSTPDEKVDVPEAENNRASTEELHELRRDIEGSIEENSLDRHMLEERIVRSIGRLLLKMDFSKTSMKAHEKLVLIESEIHEKNLTSEELVDIQKNLTEQYARIQQKIVMEHMKYLGVDSLSLESSVLRFTVNNNDYELQLDEFWNPIHLKSGECVVHIPGIRMIDTLLIQKLQKHIDNQKKIGDPKLNTMQYHDVIGVLILAYENNKKRIVSDFGTFEVLKEPKKADVDAWILCKRALKGLQSKEGEDTSREAKQKEIKKQVEELQMRFVFVLRPIDDPRSQIAYVQMQIDDPLLPKNATWQYYNDDNTLGKVLISEGGRVQSTEFHQGVEGNKATYWSGTNTPRVIKSPAKKLVQEFDENGTLIIEKVWKGKEEVTFFVMPDGSKMGSYKQEKDKNPELTAKAYNKNLKKVIKTPTAFESYFRHFFRYKLDGGPFSDYWQSPTSTTETSLGSNGGKARGDCEDLAIFGKDLLVSNGINAHLVIDKEGTHALLLTVQEKEGVSEVRIIDTHPDNDVISIYKSFKAENAIERAARANRCLYDEEIIMIGDSRLDRADKMVYVPIARLKDEKYMKRYSDDAYYDDVSSIFRGSPSSLGTYDAYMRALERWSDDYYLNYRLVQQSFFFRPSLKDQEKHEEQVSQVCERMKNAITSQALYKTDLVHKLDRLFHYLKIPDAKQEMGKVIREGLSYAMEIEDTKKREKIVQEIRNYAPLSEVLSLYEISIIFARHGLTLKE